MDRQERPKSLGIRLLAVEEDDDWGLARLDLPTVTVYVEDDGPERTGLLDAQGRPLYRVRERVPMGFHRR